MTDKRLAPGVWLLPILFAALAYYYTMGPDGGLPCPIYRISGWKCAGCGVQRALHALTQGRVWEAFQYNPLFVAALPALFFWGLRGMLTHRQSFRKVNGLAVLGTIGLLLLYMLIRNVLGF